MPNMDFYNLQDSYKYIIEEGYFHVPENVLISIKEFYIENYKQYLKNGKGRISDKLYPPKEFKLDFSGTRFEFLNDRSPSVKVYLSSKTSQYSDFNPEGEDTLELFHQGNIHLELNDNIFKTVVYNLIEHEMMHYIQHLMNSLHKEFGAGFPNRKLWRKGLNPYGRRIDGSGRTTVTHSQRPIEYYPDLLSAIRELFQNYHDKIKNSREYEILKDNPKSKGYFFSNFIKAINDPEYSNGVYNYGLTIHTFREFKKISPEFYNKMVKIAYDAFVNREPNFNPKEIEKELKNIQINDAFDKI